MRADVDASFYFPLPPLAGGEGWVRGVVAEILEAAHLTLPSLHDGPLPLPPMGGEGLVLDLRC
jgi:hypothetical protein